MRPQAPRSSPSATRPSELAPPAPTQDQTGSEGQMAPSGEGRRNKTGPVGGEACRGAWGLPARGTGLFPGCPLGPSSEPQLHLPTGEMRHLS